MACAIELPVSGRISGVSDSKEEPQIRHETPRLVSVQNFAGMYPHENSCARALHKRPGPRYGFANLGAWHRIQPGERRLLPAMLIKICGVKPALKIRPSHRPLRIEHGESCRVAISPLDDHVLPENPFEPEAEAQRCPPRRCIQGIALPFVAAVPQVLENMTRHEIHGLGGQRGGVP